MNTNLTKPLMFAPSPWVKLRIALRRVALAWRTSEYLQPLTVAAAITLVLFGSIVAIVWAVW